MVREIPGLLRKALSCRANACLPTNEVSQQFDLEELVIHVF